MVFLKPKNGMLFLLPTIKKSRGRLALLLAKTREGESNIIDPKS